MRIFCGLEYFVCVWIFCRHVYCPNKCTKLINVQGPLHNGNIWKVYYFFECCWHFQIPAPSADNKRGVKLLLGPDKVIFVTATIIYFSSTLPYFWLSNFGSHLTGRNQGSFSKQEREWLKQLNWCLRGDSFATYDCSCRIYPLKCFVVFRLKYNKNFQPANATSIRVCCKWIHPKQEPCPKLGPVCMEVEGPLVSEVTRFSGVTRLSILSLTLIWSRFYDRWGDPPHVTSPVWGPPPSCKQALRIRNLLCKSSTDKHEILWKKYAIHGRNEKFKIEPAEVLESTHPKTNKPLVKTYSFLNELQGFKPRQNLSPETKALQKTTRRRIK